MKNVALAPSCVEQGEQRIGLAGERGSGPLPVGHAEPPADELVPVLEVDAEQERVSVGRWRGGEVRGRVKE